MCPEEVGNDFDLSICIIGKEPQVTRSLGLFIWVRYLTLSYADGHHTTVHFSYSFEPFSFQMALNMSILLIKCTPVVFCAAWLSDTLHSEGNF